jgi:hypothetical protein
LQARETERTRSTIFRRIAMIGRREFGVAGLSAAALLAAEATGFANQKARPTRSAKPASNQDPEHREHDEAFEECAKACSDCQRACDACATHCAHELHAGNTEHMATLGTCLDCADFCATASKITARGGVFADLICASCAEACARCAKECEKMSQDEHMAKCAKECHDCETACRKMIKHVG